MSTSLYWIRHKDHTDMFSEGYIGVSKNVEARWLRHSRYSDNQHLKAAIKKYGWDNLIKEVILVGEEAYCYDLESKIRPTKQIGWNIAEGGAKPPVTQYRGDDYISPLKGVPKQTPWMFGRKPWNAGKIGYWSEEQTQKFVDGVSKPHSKEHIEKRQATRKATRIAKGQIKQVQVNGNIYECARVAAEQLGIPEATIKHWCYGKGKPGKKYAHIKECRWI
jgi:group I intron endonuclease